VANWITGAVFQYLGANNKTLSDTKLTPGLLNELDALVQSGKVSLQTAKEKVFPEVMEKGVSPEKIVQEKGLAQVSDDGAILAWIQEVIAANPKVVADFKSGKETAAMFLVGQTIKKSQGKASPTVVKELLLKTLKGL
jgi:aspartyl-tRNA(Asn)/glutamyl-tRNA(Gln) amidotransferase subunit B